jgi:hypothetical protein
MPNVKRAHLRAVGKSEVPTSDRCAGPRHAATALKAIAGAGDAEEAFRALHEWAVGPAARSATADVVEEELHVGGREVLRLLLQESIAARGVGDVGPAVVLVEGGQELRLGEHRDHTCNYASLFGDVSIQRQGYWAPGQSSVHPLDEALNLPMRSYSYPVQERISKLVARAPYEEAITTLAETTGVKLPKRQAEEIVEEAAADFDAFYKARISQMPPPDETGEILVGGLDCKGVPRRKTREELAEPRPAHLGKGEKRQIKKMATVASVHTVRPHYRTAQEVVSQLLDPRDPSAPRRSTPRPAAEYRRVWASVSKSKDAVIEEVAAEMRRRDPSRKKVAACLTDGERALQKRALRHIVAAFPGLILILDIMHVLSYLWEAAHAFHAEGSENARLWVRQRLLQILQGQVSSVVAGMRQSATKQGLTGSKRRAVDKACNYMLRNKQFMRYHEYLARGLPIASGAVEGACGHLVRDRLERTGAIWTLEGAESVLQLRALDKSGDFDAYWAFHLDQERHRNYAIPWRAAA